MKKILSATIACLLFAACENPHPQKAEGFPGFFCVKKIAPAEQEIDELAAAEEQKNLELTLKVERKLLADKSLLRDDTSLTISSSDGIVTVVGTVEDKFYRNRILKKIKRIKGVKGIDNQIVVAN